MAEAGFGLFFLFWIVWVFGGFALWIWALVDVSKKPEHAFRMVGRDKTNWILVVALAQVIGALIWRFGSARDQVKAYAATNPYGPPVMGPPPGWYPDPSGAPGVAWWDGRAWTGHRQGSSIPTAPSSPPFGGY